MKFSVNTCFKVSAKLFVQSKIEHRSLPYDVSHGSGHHEKMAKRLYFLHKDGVAMKSRKLLEADQEVQLDYDYAGPNPKHDPRKGRGGRSL